MNGAGATIGWGLLGFGVVVLVAVHVAFPAVLFVRSRLRRRPIARGDAAVPVSIIVAAHDEAAVIAFRIQNLLSLDYPTELLQIVVACDGDPATYEAACRSPSPQVTVLDLPRVGKAGAMNRALSHVRHDVVAFTDANCTWEATALRELVRPLADPTVGGCAGDQRYSTREAGDPVADAEASYWSYDRSLKSWQSASGSVTSATGAIHALRRVHVEHVPPDVTDDFFLSTGAVVAGQRLVFVPTARSWEPLAANRGAEFRRKVRLITRGLRSVLARRVLLDPRRHGWYAIQLFVHKVLRRVLLLPMLAMLVGAAVGAPHDPMLRVALALQAVFYLAAAVGALLPPDRHGGVLTRAVAVPSYICMVAAASTVAIANVIVGRGYSQWGHERASTEPSPRSSREEGEAS